jgi:aspartyl-tRNA(Asn)/glutamyl-tRNA(Gln) amidotransferase subunit C
MAITYEDIEHIAHLARLSFAEPEKEKFQKELSNILAYVEQLEKVDTKGVDLDSAYTEHANQFREDTPVSPSAELREKLFRNAPKTSDNFFQVRAVLE